MESLRGATSSPISTSEWRRRRRRARSLPVSSRIIDDALLSSARDHQHHRTQRPTRRCRRFSIMGGPGLEVFKFALYLALPIGVMVHYGKPEWYTQHVLPVRAVVLPTSLLPNRVLQYRDRIFPSLRKDKPCKFVQHTPSLTCHCLISVF